jgi:pyruvate,orthophosphate dikinase
VDNHPHRGTDPRWPGSTGKSTALASQPIRATQVSAIHLLLEALNRVEEHYRDACYLEFTFEAGELWMLQARPGRFVGTAAVRGAAELADEA